MTEKEALERLDTIEKCAIEITEVTCKHHLTVSEVLVMFAVLEKSLIEATDATRGKVQTKGGNC